MITSWLFGWPHRARWLLIASVFGSWLVGCAGDGPNDGDQMLEAALGADGCPVARPTPGDFGIVAEAVDLELCEALSEREDSCFAGCPATVETSTCARRYACSRQLWRQDIAEDVYACIRERPCDDPEPTTSCLQLVASRVEPSRAQLRFEAELKLADAECGPLLDVSPGQVDRVYEALTSCLNQQSSCDAKSACVMVSLEAIVDNTCGARDEI